MFGVSLLSDMLEISSNIYSIDMGKFLVSKYESYFLAIPTPHRHFFPVQGIGATGGQTATVYDPDVTCIHFYGFPVWKI